LLAFSLAQPDRDAERGVVARTLSTTDKREIRRDFAQRSAPPRSPRKASIAISLSSRIQDLDAPVNKRIRSTTANVTAKTTSLALDLDVDLDASTAATWQMTLGDVVSPAASPPTVALPPRRTGAGSR
jgi:hypothetical protein